MMMIIILPILQQFHRLKILQYKQDQRRKINEYTLEINQSGNPNTQATLDTRHRVKTNKTIKHNTANTKVSLDYPFGLFLKCIRLFSSSILIFSIKHECNL
jgi:hypothetical protein